MAYLLEQADALNRIFHVIRDDLGSRSCNHKYCFEIFGAGKEKTAVSSIKVFEAYDAEGLSFSDSALFEVTDLVVDLHNLMEIHTGVPWTSMTLTLDADGRATAKFHYPEGGEA